jgi:NhaC family Na+:H+ antiporter
MTDTSESNARAPMLWEALIPVASLSLLIGGAIIMFGADPQIPLILAAAIAGLIGVRLGHSWKHIQQGIVDTISVGLSAILILMVIGIMIGTWIACGTVPLLIDYGLKFLNPQIFLIATCLVCCVVSLATGSSWTTAATVGIALIGVGQGLGVPLPMVAGAIVSGAYFGDKMSPLSDSTNLAPAVAGSELFEHIRHMVYTTVPALVISLILYGIIGIFVIDGKSDSQAITQITTTLQNNFNLSPLLLLPPLLILVMAVYRVHALPAILAGSIIGAIMAITVQDLSLKVILDIGQNGFTSETGVASVDELLSRGGLSSMMFTVSLVLCALTFGGVMERTGMLHVIADRILKLARSTGSLVLTTVSTCITMNIMVPDQYLSIIVPGRMYRNAYKEAGLHPKNLSRTLEDSGTLSSPLIPWNTCGAYMWTTLGVFPFAYAPYAFLNLLCPIVAVFLAYMGWKQTPLNPTSK